MGMPRAFFSNARVKYSSPSSKELRARCDLPEEYNAMASAFLWAKMLDANKMPMIAIPTIGATNLGRGKFGYSGEGVINTIAEYQ